MSIESVMPSNHLIFYLPLLLLPSSFPSIRVFSNESGLLIRWPKYWSFSFSISPSNECTGLISFMIDCSDLLVVQGNLKSLLRQFKSINSLALSLLYGPTLTSIHDCWKNHSLTIWTFVNKVMSLLFNTLSRFVKVFFQGASVSFNFMAEVIICSDLGAQEYEVCHCIHCFPIYLPWSDGTGCRELCFWMLSFKPAFQSPLSPSS